MGTWIHKIPSAVPAHKCERPDSEREKFRVGSIWQCDCGAIWRFKKRDYDQRDGSAWDDWELTNREAIEASLTITNPINDSGVPEHLLARSRARRQQIADQERDVRGVGTLYAPGTK